MSDDPGKTYYCEGCVIGIQLYRSLKDIMDTFVTVYEDGEQEALIDEAFRAMEAAEQHDGWDVKTWREGRDAAGND